MRIGMIMQSGMGAFDPSSVVGVHFQETLKAHFGWSKGEAEANMKSDGKRYAFPSDGDHE